MKHPTTKGMIDVARKEIEAWRTLPQGLVLAILFAFIHRYTTGRTVEDTFFHRDAPAPDYEI